MGFTRHLRKRWLEGPTLRKAFACAKTPYVGYLPKDLLKLTSENPKLFYEWIDELCSLLTPVHNCISLMKCVIKGSNIRIETHRLSSGRNGVAFRINFLKDGSKKYCSEYILKLYFNEEAQYTELGLGTHLIRKNLKNLAHFYLGNPVTGWGIFEFIPQDMNSGQRTGHRIQELGFELYDDHPNNRINDIRVDYGEIYSAEGRCAISPVKTIQDFCQAYDQNPYYVIQACSALISHLPLKDRLPVYRMLMSVPVTREKAITAIPYLPKKYRPEFYTELFEQYPSLVPKYPRVFHHMPRKLRYDMVLVAARYPESRADLGNVLPYLDSKKRYLAFELLMQFSECRASCISNIGFLSRKDRYKAFLSTLKYADSFPGFQKRFQWPAILTQEKYMEALDMDPEFAAFAVFLLPISLQTKVIKHLVKDPAHYVYLIENFQHFNSKERSIIFNSIFLNHLYRRCISKTIIYLPTITEKLAALDNYANFFLRDSKLLMDIKFTIA